MSDPAGQNRGMKAFFPFANQEQVIARFGGASLVRNHQGTVELRGGGPSDHSAAREWISLFMHELAPRSAPPRDNH
jgi:hypothetical protein